MKNDQYRSKISFEN